jgi:hypothetical protein
MATVSARLAKIRRKSRPGVGRRLTRVVFEAGGTSPVRPVPTNLRTIPPSTPSSTSPSIATFVCGTASRDNV